MDDQNTKYVQDQLAAGKLPTQIVQELTASGWQEAQATALVQQVSGVQITVAAGPGGYTKPPLILTILFIIYIFVLLGGIAYSFIGIAIFTQYTNPALKYIGFGTLAFGLLLIALFWNVRKMRQGSLMALKIYSVLVLLGTAASAYIGYQVGQSSVVVSSDGILPGSAAEGVGQNLIALLVCLYIWKRHRTYFR